MLKRPTNHRKQHTRLSTLRYTATTELARRLHVDSLWFTDSAGNSNFVNVSRLRHSRTLCKKVDKVDCFWRLCVLSSMIDELGLWPISYLFTQTIYHHLRLFSHIAKVWTWNGSPSCSIRHVLLFAWPTTGRSALQDLQCGHLRPSRRRWL